MIATFRTIDSESVLAMFDEDLVTCIKEVASEYYDRILIDDKEAFERACFDTLLMLVHERGERARS